MGNIVYMLRLLILVGFVIFSLCSSSTFCHLKNSDGKNINLYQVASKTEYTYSISEQIISFNICEDSSRFCKMYGVSGYYASAGFEGDDCKYIMGRLSETDTSVTEVSVTSDGASIRYYKGDKTSQGGQVVEYNTQINVACDKDVQTDEQMQNSIVYSNSIIGSGYDVYIFDMKSKWVCPNQDRYGLTYPLGSVYGFGGLFMTLLPIPIIIYFIIVFIVKITCLKKRRWDMIPHRKGCILFPFLVFNGCMFYIDAFVFCFLCCKLNVESVKSGEKKINIPLLDFIRNREGTGVEFIQKTALPGWMASSKDGEGDKLT